MSTLPDSSPPASRPGTLRILLADDHELVRQGLRFVLEGVPGWRVCGEASDGAEAVEAARRLRPHVAVMDLDMPVLDGFEAIRAIRQLSTATAVVALTGDDRPDTAERARHAGADRLILKTSGSAEVTRAIRELIDERNRAGGHATPRAGGLTTRELEVARLLALGKSNADVARMLGISAATADTHRQNVLRKLGAASIVEVVLFAIREELVLL